MLTNGRVKANLDYDSTNSHTVPEESQWHMRLPHRPDSVIGWYKGKPSPGDFPTMKVLLHTGYASLPQDDSSTWIGVAYAELSTTEVSNWTRFSAPFEYFNDETPEFMLTILTSGNGTNAIEGSEAWFDDIELIYNDGTDIGELTAEDLNVTFSYGTLNVFIADQSRTEGSLLVHDISGRQVFAGEITAGELQQYPLNLDHGIYLVTVSMGKKQITKKVFFI
jgi:hypothetical protein